MDTQLFEKLVQQCGLSPLFAENAMRRACVRAGVPPEELSAQNLTKALPEIAKALRPFLEGRVDEVMARVKQLAS